MNIEVITDRDIFDESIKEISKKEIVLDLGAGKRFHKALSKYKEFFKITHYYALDISKEPDLDIIGDIHKLPFKDKSIDGVICISVLEHVFEPQVAVKEVYRVLKEKGIAFFYIPFLFPYHGSSNHPDCYRFTKDAIMYIFKDFSRLQIQPLEGYVGTTLRFMSGFLFPKSILRFIINKLERLINNLIKLIRQRPIQRMHNTIGFNLLVRK